MNSEKKVYPEDLNEEDKDNQQLNVDEQFTEIDDNYKFGWSSYSEVTNGRFAMLGFIAIILIEFFSQKSFLTWAGIQ